MISAREQTHHSIHSDAPKPGTVPRNGAQSAFALVVGMGAVGPMLREARLTLCRGLLAHCLPCVHHLYLWPHKTFCCSWISLLSNISFIPEIEVWQSLPKSPDFRGSMPRVRTPLCPSLLPVFETTFVCSPHPRPRCSPAPPAAAAPPSLGLRGSNPYPLVGAQLRLQSGAICSFLGCR